MNNIPKILHLYWDRTPMSWLQTMTIDTFCKHNPDWKVNVYIPKQAYTGKISYIPNYVGKDFFDHVENNPNVNIVSVDLNGYSINIELHNILRSDILRYHLLHNVGGVWSDFDIIWLKPMSHLSKIAGRSDFNATICMFEGRKRHYTVSPLVSVRKHPLYKSIVKRCNLIQNSFKGTPTHEEYGSKIWNEMFPSLHDVLNKYTDIVSLKYATFFPYSIYEIERLYKKTDLSVITEDVMCVHWFNGHKLSKEYINSGVFDKECSMTELIKLIGNTT